MTRSVAMLCAAVAVGSSALLFSPSIASAREGRGFLADVGVATGLISGDQADVLDRAYGSGGFQAASGPAAPPQQMSNYCVIPDGRAFYYPQAFPVGSPCVVPFVDHPPVDGIMR